jgi:hypothetical protein
MCTTTRAAQVILLYHLNSTGTITNIAITTSFCVTTISTATVCAVTAAAVRLGIP